MLKGQCLCGAIKFKIEGDLAQQDGSVPVPLYCHCKMCQRLTGSAFTASVMVSVNQFQWLSGEELLKNYQSSPEAKRSFCSECGSSLTFVYEDVPESIYIAAGTIDEPCNFKMQSHIYVADKASWYNINDDLVQFDAEPDT